MVLTWAMFLFLSAPALHKLLPLDYSAVEPLYIKLFSVHSVLSNQSPEAWKTC